MPRATHYDVLGVAPDATAAEIRDAYRRLARDHHPDRPSSAAGGRSMPDINEAYRVLGDPARRAVYDASRRDPAAPAPDADDPPPAPVAARLPGPTRVPWRTFAVVGGLAIVVFAALSLFSEPARPPGIDGLIRIGDCVEVDGTGFASETACTGDERVDRVVEDFVPFDGDCPAGTGAFQDRQGMGIACVALR